jgi:glycosyltransferase involved in cell wall biosynthesis
MMKCGFKDKLVSVVMTAYNTEKYIGEAINCILKQSYKNFEFIIIDDGSTDHTLDIIMEYAKTDKRIIVITRKNIGLSQSLNDGIRIARGEYIARMDSDDVCSLDRFEKQVNYLNCHPDVHMLGSNYYIIYDDGLSEECIKKYKGSHKRGQVEIDHDNMFLSISESQKFMHASAMIRRELYDKVGYYNDYMSEDIEFNFRVASRGYVIAKLVDELYGYRAREDSKSYVESRAEQSEGIIETKLKWLMNELSDDFRKVRYLIWGADISGEVALRVIGDRLPESECIAFIDPMKTGEFCGKKIIIPERIGDFNVDYIFICTQAGAVSARKLLKESGRTEILEYFKLS